MSSTRIPISATIYSKTADQVTSKLVCIGNQDDTIGSWTETVRKLYVKRFPQERIQILAVQTLSGAQVDQDFLLSEIASKREETELVVVVDDALPHLQQWQMASASDPAAPQIRSRASSLSSLSLSSSFASDGLSNKSRANLLKDGRAAQSKHVPEGSIAKLRRQPLEQELVHRIQHDIEIAQLARPARTPFAGQSLKRRRESQTDPQPVKRPSIERTSNDEKADLIVKANPPLSSVTNQSEEAHTSEHTIPGEDNTKPIKGSDLQAVSQSNHDSPSTYDASECKAAMDDTVEQAGHANIEHNLISPSSDQDSVVKSADDTSDLDDFMSSDDETSSGRNKPEHHPLQNGVSLMGRNLHEHASNAQALSSPETVTDAEPFAKVSTFPSSQAEHLVIPASTVPAQESDPTAARETSDTGERSEAESMVSGDVHSDSSSTSSSGEDLSPTKALGIVKERPAQERGLLDGSRGPGESMATTSLPQTETRAQEPNTLKNGRPLLANRPFKSLSWLANQPPADADGSTKSSDNADKQLESANYSIIPSAQSSPVSQMKKAFGNDTESSDSEESLSSAHSSGSNGALPTSKRASASNSPAHGKRTQKKSRGVRGLLG